MKLMEIVFFSFLFFKIILLTSLYYKVENMEVHKKS